MSFPSENVPFQYELIENKMGDVTILLKGRMDKEAAGTFLRQIHKLIKSKVSSSLSVDIESLNYFDDYGALALMEIKECIKSIDKQFKLIGTNDRVISILNLFDRNLQAPNDIKTPPTTRNPLVLVGESSLKHFFNIRYMLSFVGSVALAFLQIIIHPKSLRYGDTLTCMEKTGVAAVPIVGLISFLLGLIMAFMSSIQLQQFGANIYVASLVAIAMVSELGPIMTAIVVAGRSGSAFAAEIGTMKISEEVDALYTMGFNPTLFLAVPRIVASLIVVPILALFSDIFAIAGGLTVGVLMLDLTASSYISQTIETLTLFEVTWGLMKSMVFALLISWVGCLRGFQVRGGAAAVGNAATSAVVTSIFLIILFDSLFPIIRTYWG